MLFVSFFKLILDSRRETAAMTRNFLNCMKYMWLLCLFLIQNNLYWFLQLYFSYIMCVICFCSSIVHWLHFLRDVVTALSDLPQCIQNRENNVGGDIHNCTMYRFFKSTKQGIKKKIFNSSYFLSTIVQFSPLSSSI